MTFMTIYIKCLRQAGGLFNSTIIISAAKGIITHKNPSLLKEYRGGVELGGKGQSFLLRRGYVKCKVTKAARKLPPDFSDLKQAFLTRIRDEVESNSIPPQLLINWDHTGVKLELLDHGWGRFQAGCRSRKRWRTINNGFIRSYSIWQASPTPIDLSRQNHRMPPKSDVSWQVARDA